MIIVDHFKWYWILGSILHRCHCYKKDGTLYAKYENMDDIIDRIKKDKLFMMALDGQKEVIFTAEAFGTKWKILIDSYMPKERRFGDLKVLKSLYDKFWSNEYQCYENVFQYRGYFTQMVIYAEIERLANKRDDYFEPFIAVVTKEKYSDLDIISFSSDQETHEEFIAKQLANIEENIPRISMMILPGNEYIDSVGGNRGIMLIVLVPLIVAHLCISATKVNCTYRSVVKIDLIF